MKKEHFEHVYVNFKKQLSGYHKDNATYYDWYREVDVVDMRTIKHKGFGWAIVDIDEAVCFFFRIPSQEEADDILQYIKDTEVFFV